MRTLLLAFAFIIGLNVSWVAALWVSMGWGYRNAIVTLVVVDCILIPAVLIAFELLRKKL